MLTQTMRLRVVGELLVALSLWLIPSKTQAQFPDFQTLSKGNVSLKLEGFTFASGLRPNEQGKPNGRGTELEKTASCGSGFVVKSDGTLVTNYHVIRRKLRGLAMFESGATYEMTQLRAFNPRDDIALVKIKSTEPLTTVPLGDSSTVQPGESVRAVGNTLCERLSVADGIVNQVQRDRKTDTIAQFKHSAPIEGGNSGGALYRGQEVIGINVSIDPRARLISHAIPIDKMKPLLQHYAENAVPLEEIFPTTPRAIKEKFDTIFARNGQVNPKAAQEPGLWDIKVGLEQLEDVAIVLTFPPGGDLDLLVLDPQVEDAKKRLIGYGGSKEEEVEVVLLANTVPRTVVVRVLNYHTSPVSFGLTLHSIRW